MATLYESYTTASNINSGSINATSWIAQTFTPSTAHKITSVKLLLYRYSTPGTITVGIRATDGSGHPTGGDLCSGTTNGDTLPTGSPYEWREITLGAGATLSADTKYAIVARALSASGVKKAIWRVRNPGGYDGGAYGASGDSGGTWSFYSDAYDALFEDWGDPIQTISPSAIASAEAFGTAKLNLKLEPSAIASAEAFGSLTVVPGVVTLAPTGIASAEAFGTPQVFRELQYLLPSSIASAEAFGALTVIPGEVIILPSAIASAEALGSPSIIPGAVIVAPTGIASGELFGTPQLNLFITPTGIVTSEAFGTLTIIPGEVFVIPSAIASLEAFGTPKLNLKLEPSGITSLEAFGTPKLNFRLFLTAIASAEAFGTPRLGLYLLPSAIASAEAFGTPTILWQLFLLPTSIASAEAFGTPLLFVILASGDGMKLRTDKGQAAIFHE